MKNLTDFRETVETGMDPRLGHANPGKGEGGGGLTLKSKASRVVLWAHYTFLLHERGCVCDEPKELLPWRL